MISFGFSKSPFFHHHLGNIFLFPTSLNKILRFGAVVFFGGGFCPFFLGDRVSFVSRLGEGSTSATGFCCETCE